MKYVRLNPEKDSLESGFYPKMPSVLEQLSAEEVKRHNWFGIEEVYPESKDQNLYSIGFDSWKFDKEKELVIVNYRNDLLPLEVRREYLVERVNEIRDEMLTRPIVINGIKYDYDNNSIKRVSGAVLNAILDDTYSTPWITYDNEEVHLDASEIIFMGKSFSKNEQQTVLFCRTLKNKILNSEEPENIDLNDGWPEPVFEVTDNS